MFEEYKDEFVDLHKSLVDGCLGEVLEWLQRRLIYSTSRLVLALEALRSSIKEVIVSDGRGFVGNLMAIVTLIMISGRSIATVELSTVSMSTSASCSHSRSSSACFAISSGFRTSSGSGKIIELWLLAHTLLEAILEWDGCAFFIVTLAGGATTAPRLQLSGGSRLPAHSDLLHMLCHLFASNHLAETLIELLFEENLRLGPAYKYLSDELGFVENTRVPYSSALLLLSLSSESLGLLRLFYKPVLGDIDALIPHVLSAAVYFIFFHKALIFQ